MNGCALRLKTVESVSERPPGLSCRRRFPGTRPPLVALALVSIAATAPVALTRARTATARGLLVTSERMVLCDALRQGSAEESSYATSDAPPPWQLTYRFRVPAHLGLLRAQFGTSPTSGVPTDFHWEALVSPKDAASCDDLGGASPGAWTSLVAVEQGRPAELEGTAQPTHRSWFVRAEACGLRLLVDHTNAGPPVIRDLQAIESAVDVLESARASDDGSYPGFRPQSAFDGVYSTRWVGLPGRSQWTLRADLAEPIAIDRIRLVLGFGPAGVPRDGGGRAYSVAWAPMRYVLEASSDGEHFATIARDRERADGTVLPLRRRLVTLPGGRSIRALRLVMTGATGASGLPEPDGVPVVREIAAYRADDRRPILAHPWILSVNANPSAQLCLSPGGCAADDAYHARLLQARFSEFLPALQSDTPSEAIEAVEGDDPQLDASLLAESSPPPIVVLSGSNDWDYAAETGPDRDRPMRWHWDPLRDARYGGMGGLAEAVQERVAPFLGFCGGAQILALLEARAGDTTSSGVDLATIDRVLQRTRGGRVRGFAAPEDLERAWPTDPRPTHTEVRFLADDDLFADVAGPSRRSATLELPEWHADAIRADAFERGGPLERLQVVASSTFCGPTTVPDGSRGTRSSACETIPEAFRSRDRAWPVIGAQFHAEQRDFATAAPGDPPEAVADPRLFLASAYEEFVDAYERFAP